MTGSDRFAQLAHAVLGKALKQATVEGLIPRNPMDAVEPPRYVPKTRQAFSAEIAAHIIATAYRHSDEMVATRMAMAFLTGARRGELLGLEWDRVNLDEGWIDLAWQLQRLPKDYAPGPGVEARRIAGTLWWTRPKSEAGKRVLPIYHLPPLMAALAGLYGHIQPYNPHGLVFHHDDGRPISPEEHYADWKALLQAAGVAHVPMHTIRHTTTTLLRKAGVPLDIRMRITGHSSVEAHSAYVHLEREDDALALGNLSALMPSGSDGNSVPPRPSRGVTGHRDSDRA
jgi:integrase